MSEFLNNVLKAAMIGSWLMFLGGGLYLAGAGLGADMAIEKIAKQYAKAQTQEQRQAIVKYYKSHPWYKLTIAAARRPDVVRRAVLRAFPGLDLSRAVALGSKGFRSSWQWNRELMIKHQLSFIFAGLLLAAIFEFVLYPWLRQRLARALASTDEKIYGRLKDLPRGDGFILAQRLQLAADGGGNPHCLTIGPSGNGKTTCQVIPSLLTLPDNCSAIVTDPKGELLARCGDYLRSRGHAVYSVGPLVGFGHGWDPLRECRDEDEVRELARQLLIAGNSGQGSGKEDSWIRMSRSCLSSYLLQAWVDDEGLSHALEMLFKDEASGEAIDDPEAKLDYSMFQAMQGSGATVGSVLATVQGAAAPWLMAKVTGWLNCPRQFKIENLRREKAAVFLVTSASDMRATQAIQQVFFSMLFSRLAEGGEGRVRFFLDEFANLGSLEGIDHALNLLRSSGVALHAFVQNLSQLQAVYGRDCGAVVSESFGTVAIMSGLRNDADNLAKLLGLRDDVRASFSTMDEKMRAQFGQNQQQVLQGSMLRQIRRDEVLIISGNLKPVLAKLRPYFRIRKLMKRIPAWARPDWARVDQSLAKKYFAGFGVIEPGKRIEVPANPAPQKPEPKPMADQDRSEGWD